MWVRVLVLLVLAGGVGYGTIMLSQQWLASQGTANPATQQPQIVHVEPEYTHILVASSDLAVGQFIKETDLSWQPWPERGISPNYAVQGGEVAIENLVNGVARQPIAAGEPVLMGNIVRPGERGFLSAVLGPGMRAVTVPINPRSGIAGFVFPGDRVDLILTHSFEPATEGADSFDPAENRTVSETVLLDLRVLAIDQALGDPENGAAARMGSLATIEVTPQQAEMINVLLELGSLSLSLRSLADPDQPDVVAALAQRGIEPQFAMDSPEGQYFGAEAQLQPILGRSVTYDSDVSQVLLPPIILAQSEPEVTSEPAPAAPLSAPVMIVETTILRGSASPTARH